MINNQRLVVLLAFVLVVLPVLGAILATGTLNALPPPGASTTTRTVTTVTTISIGATCGNQPTGSGCGYGLCQGGYTCTQERNPPDRLCSGGVWYACLPNTVSTVTTITVIPPLQAYQPYPSPAALDSGQSIVMTAAPGGGRTPYSYQWFEASGSAPSAACGQSGWTLEPGQTRSTFSFTSPPNLGSPLTDYVCYALRDSSGQNAASPAAQLPISQDPQAGAIIPATNMVDLGQINAIVEAQPQLGTTPYRYQWTYDAFTGTPPTSCGTVTSPVPSSNAQSISVSPPSNTAYCYTLGDSSIGTPAATAVSNVPSLVMVNPALVAGAITPSGPTIDAPGSVTLQSDAYGGTPPYSYQWYLGSEPSGTPRCINDPGDAIPGATNVDFVASPPSNAIYCYAVTDSLGVVQLSPPDFVTVVPRYVAPTQNSCGYAASGGPGGNYVNANNWIAINYVVVLVTIMIAGLLYAISGIMPTSTREKLRGAARYEAIQGVVSVLIIMILILFASTVCYAGETMASQITGGGAAFTSNLNYQGPFQYAENYLASLLYQKGLTISTNLYSTAVDYSINADVIELGGTTITNILQSSFKPLAFGPVEVEILPSFQIGLIYLSYSTLFVDLYGTLTVLTFGGLFMLWLLLFFIYSISLTLVVPIAIIARSFGFVGPKLREASEQLLAIAIAFYFILPIMISFNSYAVGWMYANNNPAFVCANGACNPLNSLTPSSLFTQGTVNTGGFFDIGLPLNLINLGSGGMSWANLNTLLAAPTAAQNFAAVIAEYMFEGVVLLALDFAVTLGFAVGLAKGLNAISGLISSGPVWGG